MTDNKVATKQTPITQPAPAATRKVTIELPPGFDQKKIDKALKFYEVRMDYQQTHNKARRLAQNRLSKKYNAEYKAFLKEELKKLGVETEEK